MKLKISSNGYIDINSENWMHSENSEVIQWLADGNTPEPEFIEEELQITSIHKQIQEAKTYLANTDYKMTVDYFATLSKEVQDDLITKRAETREFIRTNEGDK